ncbi:MAG: replication initiation protein [Methylococcaceae bacterium]|nr:replication initiation protein [Methylococcaceae bacterium]
MNDKNMTVCKANALIEAGYRLSLNEQRIILACIAQVDSREELLATSKFEIHVKDFAKRFNLSEEATYSDLKEASKNLYSRSLTIYNPDPEQPELKKLETRWISSIGYMPEKGKLSLRFAIDILPYLGGLKGRFTKYELEHIGNMKTTYGIRLYELLMQWKSTGKREIEIDWLKKQFELDASYERMDNLKRRVIDPAIKDINDHSNYQVSWTQRKTGRKVTHLIFAFFEKSPEGEKPKRITKPKEKMILGVPMSEIEKQAQVGESYEGTAGRINREKDTKKTPVPKTTTATPKTTIETNKEQSNMRIEVIKSLINKNKAFYLEEFNRKTFVTIKGITGAIIESDLKLAGLFD